MKLIVNNQGQILQTVNGTQFPFLNPFKKGSNFFDVLLKNGAKNSDILLFKSKIFRDMIFASQIELTAHNFYLSNRHLFYLLTSPTVGDLVQIELRNYNNC